MPAVSFTQDIRGGEQKLASVGTTWQEVRFPTRTRQVTATFDADGYLGRGQTQGGAVSNHKAIVSGSPYVVDLGAASSEEIMTGYRAVQVAVVTGTADVYVRSEV